MFTRRLIGTAAMVALMALAACGGTAESGPAPADAEPEVQVNAPADIEAVRAVIDMETVAARSDDPAALRALFTSDAVVMPPNGDMVQGDGLVGWAEAFMTQVDVAEIGYEHLDIQVSGDLAVHEHTFSWTLVPADGSEPITETGKGVHVLERQADGSWLISLDVWNSGAPAEGM